MTDHDHIVEELAARQWQRMTRSTTTYAELNEHDQQACRALVTPVLHDLADLLTGPVIRATAVAAADRAAIARAEAMVVGPLADHVTAIVDGALTATSALLAAPEARP